MKLFPEWASMMLKLTGITTAFWGLTLALFPDILFRWAGMPDPQYLFPWKMIGVIAVVFGVFYFVAAFNPARHIIVISIGLVIKLIEFIFILTYWIGDVFPLKLALYFFAKDVVLLFPLIIVLYLIFKSQQQARQDPLPALSLPEVLSRFMTVKGKSLKELSDEQPVLLIFLRHFGCTFCHEALTEIHKKHEAIEKEGVKIVLVHMASSEEAQQYFKQYALQGIDHISDPNCTLYTNFRLKRTNLKQMLKLKPWKASAELDVLWKFGSEKPAGDRFRMPGVFLIYKEELLKSYKHESVSDRPDYVALASI